MKRILYTKPSITEREVAYATDAAQNGWGEQCYEYIDKFEAAFKDYLGVKYAVATSSCTGALHMGLAGLGIGPGDEVILADTNWVATVAPVVHLGATPVFVDIRPDTWCLDPSLVESAITGRTKAIIAVHLYGNLADMERLEAIGAAHGLPVIEDAAEAIGSIYQGKAAGSMGAFGAFSFHGTKTLTTGEGGMFVTNDDMLYESVLTLSNHGRSRGQPKQFWADKVGYKYKMSNVQAAIGLAQIERVHELVSRKRQILASYIDKLELPGKVSLNWTSSGNVLGGWMPTVIFSPDTGVDRESLRRAFGRENIDARVFFHPLSSMPPFGGCAQSPVGEDIARRAINLPSYHDMTESDIDTVVRVVRGVLDAS